MVGGNCPFGSRLLGIKELVELPQGLYGSDLANALAAVDRPYNRNGLIVADLSNDATYAETLSTHSVRAWSAFRSAAPATADPSGGRSKMAPY